ncbi:ribose-5-phosphate isomerase [Granulicella rosea]|uniref:Ribose-5-phosphate isomerase A n=1 Tax=Granulicella rosea TaxID=474952 RepID=A0A239H0P3_9BACT|nr:ribose-5-phosphate isomerase RpiA [Granulicella rosea]SNS75036.1 ribose-5-phosphate isomerase [Granulicella rosea]
MSDAQQAAKMVAAQRAADLIEEGMVVGLGSGSTATLFIKVLGEKVKSGLKIRAIASSAASETLARELNIPITDFDADPVIDLTVDGADEVAPGLALIKGGGGALLREKIVASASKQFFIVADKSKIVERLGKFPLPVEVIPMAAPLVSRQLQDLALIPTIRHHADGSLYITDEGNLILDCASGPELIADPELLAAEIRAMVGVVEHGLFLGMADLALIADTTGVEEHRP